MDNESRVTFESREEELIVLDGLTFAAKPWRYRVNTSGQVLLDWPAPALRGWYDDTQQEVAA